MANSFQEGSFWISHPEILRIKAVRQQNLKAFAIIFGVLAAVLALCILTVFSVSADWSIRGQVGDSFGLTNAVFSGLAFAGLIYAILLQRKELSLQREELNLTRQELVKSADAQQKAAEAQKNLAVLNAYTALLTCKSSEIAEALNNFHEVRSGQSKKHYRDRYQNLVLQRAALEARVENVLLLMGGKVDIATREDLEKILSEPMEEESQLEEQNGEQAAP